MVVRALAIVLAGILAFTGRAAATPLYSLASASGLAVQYEVLCTSCDIVVTELSNESDGGFGSLQANASFASTFARYAATAVLGDPVGLLPTLGVWARADIFLDPPSTFFHQALATASVLQGYQFLGTAPETYSLTFAIDGHLQGGFMNHVYGGITIFDASFDPAAELNPTLGEGSSPDPDADIGPGFAYSRLQGTCVTIPCAPLPFDLTGTVEFTVAPQDSFYVFASLSAVADSRSFDQLGEVDAIHSLNLHFTKGNPALLAAVLPHAVPEPAPALVLGAGVIGFLLARRFQWRGQRQERP